MPDGALPNSGPRGGRLRLRHEEPAARQPGDPRQDGEVGVGHRGDHIHRLPPQRALQLVQHLAAAGTAVRREVEDERPALPERPLARPDASLDRQRLARKDPVVRSRPLRRTPPRRLRSPEAEPVERRGQPVLGPEGAGLPQQLQRFRIRSPGTRPRPKQRIDPPGQRDAREVRQPAPRLRPRIERDGAPVLPRRPNGIPRSGQGIPQRHPVRRAPQPVRGVRGPGELVQNDPALRDLLAPVRRLEMIGPRDRGKGALQRGLPVAHPQQPPRLRVLGRPRRLRPAHGNPHHPHRDQRRGDPTIQRSRRSRSTASTSVSRFLQKVNRSRWAPAAGSA